jgi:hypothetical protein
MPGAAVLEPAYPVSLRTTDGLRAAEDEEKSKFKLCRRRKAAVALFDDR